MPFNASRWMQQRHKHPRIGPEYQAAIPALEGSPAPRVPRAWLGGEGRGDAQCAVSADTAATGLSSGAEDVSASATAQSRPTMVTRKMRSAAAFSASSVEGSSTPAVECRDSAKVTGTKTARREEEEEEETSATAETAAPNAAAFSASLLEEAAQQMNVFGEEEAEEVLANEAGLGEEGPSSSATAGSTSFSAELSSFIPDSKIAEAETRPRFETEESATAERLGTEIPAKFSCEKVVSSDPAEEDLIDCKGEKEDKEAIHSSKLQEETVSSENSAGTSASPMELTAKHGFREESPRREAKKRRGATSFPA